MNTFENVIYQQIPSPKMDCSGIPVLLNDETMEERYEKVLGRMREEGIDTLVIYGDLEHGNNFEYLTGFLPRFEEALLILHANGRNYMVMGNENLNKVSFSRVKATPVHAPYFSLPNQPMEGGKSFSDILKEAEIEGDARIGIVGWKNFTSSLEDNRQLFDVPSYIVERIRALAGESGEVFNATYLFIGNKGARCRNNVNELEHYEFGAALASDCMLKAMDGLEEGISEMELGGMLNACGQKNSVVTIASSGKRFVKANLYPTENKVKTGDTISLTIGYKGGLSSRAGYAVEEASQLPEGVKDYVDAVVKPYFGAYATWLEEIHCGMKGNDLYQMVEQVLPKSKYHWSLCPGHLTADEEWMSSPIYDGSEEILESGMLFQIDIIPSVSGYGGTSAESTIALADEALQKEIREKAPALWKRIEDRRKYIETELHIRLNPDVLPMCSTVAYLRPLLLNKGMAMGLLREE
ncbi:M24 family metallopeptidase [Lachnospiraceae bacterium]|nr:M24 family metallopeptidase [Lachnospiraceae bacterium]